MMTYAEAKQKMLEMYPNRYFAMYTDMTVHTDGRETVMLRLYLDPGISGEAAPTWEVAFVELEKAVNGPPVISSVDPAVLPV